MTSSAKATSISPVTHARLEETARRLGLASSKMHTADFAQALDQNDPLRKFRREFFIPLDSKAKGVDPEFGEAPRYAIYFCGNSLGLMSKRVRKYVDEECDKWKKLGVEGHFNGQRPWAMIDEPVTEKLVDIVGAKNSSEIAVMNSLSCNLHMLLTSFYRPTQRRYKIIMEDAAFCSDHHVLQSQVRLRGLDPKETIVALKPKPGKHTLDTEDILRAIEREGDAIALVFLGGVQYYTGQFYDLKAISAQGRKVGATVGVDLAHAVGNVSLSLHDWGIDFAAWCTYKYLNSGPGAIGGIFVHEKHHSKTGDMAIMAGWWGQTPKTRFRMSHHWEGLEGAQAWQVSNPAVLPTVCLEASLDIFREAGGMKSIRRKSLLLTGLLEYLIRHRIDDNLAKIITPSDPERRGCQLSLLTSSPVKPVHAKLERNGVIVDVREPNVIRLAPAPLYNTFMEVYRFVDILKTALEEEAKNIKAKL